MDPQERAAGLDVTVPAPVPAFVTESAYDEQRATIAPISRRPPVEVLPEREAVARAVPRIACRICKAEMLGEMEAQSAAAPVTWGAAIDVPLLKPR